MSLEMQKYRLNQLVGLYAVSHALYGLIMGIKDKDIPRTLMEVMYFVIGIRATINWLDFS